MLGTHNKGKPCFSELAPMVAEACGNRTHLARVRRHAGFEDQEGHQAQSTSELLFQLLTRVLQSRLKLFCIISVVERSDRAPHLFHFDMNVSVGHGQRLVSQEPLNLGLADSVPLEPR